MYKVWQSELVCCCCCFLVYAIFRIIRVSRIFDTRIADFYKQSITPECTKLSSIFRFLNFHRIWKYSWLCSHSSRMPWSQRSGVKMPAGVVQAHSCTAQAQTGSHITHKKCVNRHTLRSIVSHLLLQRVLRVVCADTSSPSSTVATHPRVLFP